MPLPKGNQIAAARALLGWDQKEIAERIGVTIAAISKIEKGDNKGKASTLEKIQSVLEFAGIEFTEGDGVRKKQQHIKIFRGHHEFCTFYDDIYDVIKNHPNPDVCVTNMNEIKCKDWLAEYCEVHTFRMNKLKKSRLRVLLKENDKSELVPYCHYRWLEEAKFTDMCTYLYGDKAAFIHFGGSDMMVTLVENAAVADSMRKMFDTMWGAAREMMAPYEYAKLPD